MGLSLAKSPFKYSSIMSIMPYVFTMNQQKNLQGLSDLCKRASYLGIRIPYDWKLASELQRGTNPCPLSGFLNWRAQSHTKLPLMDRKGTIYGLPIAFMTAASMPKTSPILASLRRDTGSPAA